MVSLIGIAATNCQICRFVPNIVAGWSIPMSHTTAHGSRNYFLQHSPCGLKTASRTRTGLSAGVRFIIAWYFRFKFWLSWRLCLPRRPWLRITFPWLALPDRGTYIRHQNRKCTFKPIWQLCSCDWHIRKAAARHTMQQVRCAAICSATCRSAETDALWPAARTRCRARL